MSDPAASFPYEKQSGVESQHADASAVSAAPEANAAPNPDNLPLKLGALFEALDRFSNHVVGFPAANHPDIRSHLDTLAVHKSELTQAQTDAFAQLKHWQGQMLAMVQNLGEVQEAHNRDMEELNTPTQPLDGVALGRALLKNLGFMN